MIVKRTVKVSEMAVASSPLSGGELVNVVQGGTSKVANLSGVSNYVRSEIVISDVDNLSTVLSSLSSNSNSINASLSSYVPTTRTVNSKSLSSNLTLDKTDVGLSSVDDTSDINKPVSNATTVVLANKVDKTTTINGQSLSANVAITHRYISVANSTIRKTLSSYASTPQVGFDSVIQTDLPSIIWNLIASDVTLDASWIPLPITNNSGELVGPIIGRMLLEGDIATVPSLGEQVAIVDSLTVPTRAEIRVGDGITVLGRQNQTVAFDALRIDRTATAGTNNGGSGTVGTAGTFPASAINLIKTVAGNGGSNGVAGQTGNGRNGGGFPSTTAGFLSYTAGNGGSATSSGNGGIAGNYQSVYAPSGVSSIIGISFGNGGNSTSSGSGGDGGLALAPLIIIATGNGGNTSGSNNGGNGGRFNGATGSNNGQAINLTCGNGGSSAGSFSGGSGGNIEGFGGIYLAAGGGGNANSVGGSGGSGGGVGGIIITSGNGGNANSSLPGGNGGYGGRIQLTGGNANANGVAGLFHGGNGGLITMRGADAFSPNSGGAAGSLTTSGSGPRSGGSIDTSAGGSFAGGDINLSNGQNILTIKSVAGQLGHRVSVPANTAASGENGQWSSDATYFYYYTSGTGWLRIVGSTF